MYDFIDRYEEQRERAWPAIEAFFNNLPSSLVDLGWRFTQRLARQTSPSGQFKDALKHPSAARVAYLPLWFIDAYLKRGIVISQVEALQKNLFASAFLGFCSIRIQDDIIDEDKPDAQINELLLANLLTVEATNHLQKILPSQSPLWHNHTRHWQEYTQAVYIDKMRDKTGIEPFSEIDLLRIGHKAALLKIYPIIVAKYAGVGEDRQLNEIEQMMDLFNTGIQIGNDLDSLSSDLQTGHYTPPLVAAALHVGYQSGEHPPYNGLVGSLFLSPALYELSSKATDYLEQSLSLCKDWQVEGLVRFIQWHIDDLKTSYQEEQHIKDVPLELETLVPVADNKIPISHTAQCIDIAFQFLLNDPEYRETWEVQRSGAWGQKILLGDVFGRSFVLRILAENGRVLPDQIEALLCQYRDNGWRYYRDFKALPPDIDDIAQSICLLSYTTWSKEEKWNYIETPLHWIDSNRNEDGSFPVWLTQDIEDRPDEGWVLLGGQNCLACEANFLTCLSTLETSCAKITRWLQEGMDSVIKRWLALQHNGVYHYAPHHATRLLARLFFQSNIETPLLNREAKKLALQFEELAMAVHPSAGLSHLLMKASILKMLPTTNYDEINSSITTIINQQGYDGGWKVIDLYRCPARWQQEIGWHSSRLKTTAIATELLNFHLA